MLSFSFRLSALFFTAGAFAAVACGNIGLSSGGSDLAAANPSSNGADAAGADDAGTPTALTAADGSAAAPAITGNPLCNYGFAIASAHTCFPDTDAAASQCAVQAPDAGDSAKAIEADAGVSNNGAGETDAGLTPGGDAGVVASDAGSVGKPGAADAAVAPTPACHVIEQNETDGGLWTTQQCLAAGTGTDGAQCERSTDCAATYECVGMPGQCRPYCCAGNSACDTSSFCDVQPVVTAAFDVPVCMPVSGCDLFSTKCGAGATCEIVEDDGTTSCVENGTAAVGQECDTVHCQAGLTCLGTTGSRTCFQLCHVATSAECAPGTTCIGSSQLFKEPQYGICQ